MISAVTPAVRSKASSANHSSHPSPLTVCLMLWVYSLAKKRKASTSAATDTNIMDTASKAGPRSAPDGFFGSAPQLVPDVPAPNDVFIAGAAVKGAVDSMNADVLDDKDELADDEGVMVAGTMMIDVIEEGEEDDTGLGDVEGAAAEAAVADERILGQKVSLHDCISVLWTFVSNARRCGMKRHTL